eukprot:Gregarina_sp_Poly_1__5216@NODE_2766_length_1746_cov_176_819535_g1745_i0_p1_GENE_NODE_2766_length_1746_cov_176_819535_g1745_i0NODE_2766_length_1746_cov_176_819535_g1745_i0_p1_ORF_typecomplete_len283_score38_94CDC37_N/PF03234_14/0_014_NODE_2766_length_1746_cov_176_819535_g1745_i08421690
MTIDYSRWDKLNIDSDEDERSRRPVVTAYDQPQSVTVNSGSISVAPSRCSLPQTKIQSTSLPMPQNGAIFDDYAWEQDNTHVRFWIRLPACCSTNTRREDREVKLITERPPKDLAGDLKIPEALIASDFDEAKEDGDVGLFPAAWGMKLSWPLTKYEAEIIHSFENSIWTLDKDKACTNVLWFRYPVMLGESTWIWTLETTCPFVDSSQRFIKVELRKKKSQSLHNVNVVWDKGLLTESGSINIVKSPAEQAKHEAFLKVWSEAHAQFRAKVQGMQPTVLDI